jgi:hypothetical protein
LAQRCAEVEQLRKAVGELQANLITINREKQDLINENRLTQENLKQGHGSLQKLSS